MDHPARRYRLCPGRRHHRGPRRHEGLSRMRPSVERRPIARLRRGAFAAIPGFAIAILLQAGTPRAERLREPEPEDAPPAPPAPIPPFTIGGPGGPARGAERY